MATSLFEQYRPMSWGELLGHDKARRRIDCLRRRGLGGRVYWITGPSGVGKTTVAYLIAREIADDDYITEIDATALQVAHLAEIEYHCGLTVLCERQGRAFIVNEAHGLRRDVVRQLLVTLEGKRLRDRVAWIFTTTTQGMTLFDKGEDAPPFLSRCIQLHLSGQGLAEAFAARAKEIALAEGLDGAPLARYKRLVQDSRNNLRAVLQEIEAGGMME